MKEREKYVDIVKAVAIIAVVACHIKVSFDIYNINGFITLWRVPTLFIIGGFFLKDEKVLRPVSFVKHKIKTIYNYTIIVYLLALLLHNVFINIGWYSLDYEYSGKYVTYWTITDFAKNLILAVFCAGREVILGAMWFVYVLFIALCGFSIISYIAKLIETEKLSFEKIRFAIIFILFVVAYIFTECGYNIPRLNNSFTAMWLIYIGFLLKNKWKVKFDKFWLAILCIVIVIGYMIFIGVNISLNINLFNDVISFTILELCAIYAVCYWSKHLSNTCVCDSLSFVGRNSFYIMAFHFVGFKVCNYVMELFGVSVDMAALVPNVDSNYFYWCVYLLFGVSIPLIMITLFRIIKGRLLYYIKS